MEDFESVKLDAIYVTLPLVPDSHGAVMHLLAEVGQILMVDMNGKSLHLPNIIIYGEFIIPPGGFLDICFDKKIDRWFCTCLVGLLFINEFDEIPEKFTFLKWLKCVFTRKWPSDN